MLDLLCPDLTMRAKFTIHGCSSIETALLCRCETNETKIASRMPLGCLSTGWVKKNVPSHKIWHCCINSYDKLNSFRDIDSNIMAESRYKNSIDRSRNVWVMSAWKRRTSFAPTQGLHFSSLWNVLSDMSFHCFNEIWMWNIWKQWCFIHP